MSETNQVQRRVMPAVGDWFRIRKDKCGYPLIRIESVDPYIMISDWREGKAIQAHDRLGKTQQPRRLGWDKESALDILCKHWKRDRA